uniref:Retrovirus-related Pol polyprotein from transposon gypsy n=1 Tax=Bactrocera dorsalis TaxID=27457 RepID=A0A034VIH7_BACDO
MLQGVWPSGCANKRMLSSTTGKRRRVSPKTRRGGPTEISAKPPIILHQERGRLYALITLGGEPAEAVIDTGASKSFISPRVAEHMDAIGNSKKVAVAIEIQMADGTTSKIFDAVETTIQLGQTSLKAVLHVMPGAIDDVILGLDTLGNMGAIVSCGGHQVVLKASDAQQSTAARTMSSKAVSNVTLNTPDTRLLKRRMKKKTRREPKCRRVNRLGTSSAVNQRNEAARIRDFLDEELRKFESMNGVTTVAEHKITMTDSRPIKQRYFPRNPAMQAIINAEIDELLAKKCIEPSHSPHSAPIVLARKKNGKWRLCVDYRQLNARSVPDAYPLPRIQHILDKLRRARYISSLDLKNGYWQIPLEQGSRPYTAFTVPGRGLFQWRVMPFGLHSAPATFQRVLDQVIGPEMEPHAFAYLDDIIVIGSTFEEHIRNLRKVLQRLQQKERNMLRMC